MPRFYSGQRQEDAEGAALTEIGFDLDGPVMQFDDRFGDGQTQAESTGGNTSPGRAIAAERAVKEILLAASSDWPFLIAGNNFRSYAQKRMKEHISAAKRIIESIESDKIDGEFIRERDSLFPVFNR